MSARRPGFVSLVGAGPGDPDLLTRKAARRLAEADVVLYDALVSPRVLALAPRALRADVGKRALRRGGASTSQEAIHRAMIRAARQGKRVVRLKGGDPFVFGRGGEEALALAEAGVPFEVVPGVSSAVAAPALAGIPVTHRGLVSGFAVVSGHDERAYRPLLATLPPDRITLVVLMGVASRGAIASFLVERGWAPETPAALLLAASTPDEWRWAGRLDELGAVTPPDADAPGTLVIGEVVSLAARLSPDAVADVPAEEPERRSHARRG